MPPSTVLSLSASAPLPLAVPRETAWAPLSFGHAVLGRESGGASPHAKLGLIVFSHCLKANVVPELSSRTTRVIGKWAHGVPFVAVPVMPGTSSPHSSRAVLPSNACSHRALLVLKRVVPSALGLYCCPAGIAHPWGKFTLTAI